jgi:Lhr-like helicase
MQSAPEAEALAKARPAIVISTPRSMAAMLKLSNCPKGLKAIKSVYVDEVCVRRGAPVARVPNVCSVLRRSRRGTAFHFVCFQEQGSELYRARLSNTGTRP